MRLSLRLTCLKIIETRPQGVIIQPRQGGIIQPAHLAQKRYKGLQARRLPLGQLATCQQASRRRGQLGPDRRRLGTRRWRHRPMQPRQLNTGRDRRLPRVIRRGPGPPPRLPLGLATPGQQRPPPRRSPATALGRRRPGRTAHHQHPRRPHQERQMARHPHHPRRRGSPGRPQASPGLRPPPDRPRLPVPQLRPHPGARRPGRRHPLPAPHLLLPFSSSRRPPAHRPGPRRPQLHPRHRELRPPLPLRPTGFNYEIKLIKRA